VIIRTVRWVVTLSGSQRDAERLLAESLEDLSADRTDAGHLVLAPSDSTACARRRIFERVPPLPQSVIILEYVPERLAQGPG
jgi:hypothetical protein